MFPSTIMGTHTCNLPCMCNRGYIPTRGYVLTTCHLKGCLLVFGMGSEGLAQRGGALSQLATGGVTCHACHGCVTDFRPILGNPVEVTHVTSPGHVYIFPH